MDSPQLYLIADTASHTWNTIWVGADAYPHSGSSTSCSASSAHSSLYHDNDRGTAYTIGIAVMEKPWGAPFCNGSEGSSGSYSTSGGSCTDYCNGWDSPEDQGTRPINGETRRWYHLWDENDNAIRAKVEPDDLVRFPAWNCRNYRAT